MKAPFARVALTIAILAAGGYAVFMLRGSGGLRALHEKEASIRAMERANESLAKEIERRRAYIRRLSENPAEQEIEIRERLKLVHPNEKVYITPESQKEKKPAAQ
jgi:cell division protein FtsB